MPVAEAGSPKNVTLPDSVIVTGSGTDADGKVVAYLWSQVSGPTNSVIINPGATTTAIKFTVPGSYLFQLMVTDDKGATGIDTVSIAITGSRIEGNKIPVSNAGPAKTITLPDTVTVTGSGTDVDGKVVAYLWSQVSGPAPSTITNPGSPTTGIKFTDAGTYVFQLLVVDDKGATGVSTTTIVVKPMPGTLTLQPTNNNTEILLVQLNGVNTTGYTDRSVEATAWTGSGNPYYTRTLLKFDLSSIPASATIKSAKLYLYSNPAPNTGNQVDANYGSTNTMLIQQVTSAWTYPGVTFTNLPTLSTSNQIVIAQAPQGQLDITVDVTSMVGSMVNNNANYGFYFRIQNETPLNSRIFVGSRNTTYPDKHPKLEVTYQ